jgi:hypothetical protein
MATNQGGRLLLCDELLRAKHLYYYQKKIARFIAQMVAFPCMP